MLAPWVVATVGLVRLTPVINPVISTHAQRSSRIIGSMFVDDPETLRREQRTTMIAKRFALDEDEDWQEIANRAASSLPEEEDGTWWDVAACSLRNTALVAVLLTAVGSLPGEASAAVPGEASAALPLVLLAGEEEQGVIAIIAVPLIVGGALVALAASQYNNLIDKLNGDQ